MTPGECDAAVIAAIEGASVDARSKRDVLRHFDGIGEVPDADRVFTLEPRGPDRTHELHGVREYRLEYELTVYYTWTRQARARALDDGYAISQALIALSGSESALTPVEELAPSELQADEDVAYEVQTTAYDAPDAAPSWVPFKGTRSDLDFAREIETFDVGVAADFEADEVSAGSKHGTPWTTKVPLRKQVSSYDPSAGDPVSDAAWTFLESLVGTSSTGTYDAAEIAAGCTANTWDLTTPATCAPGDCYIAANSGSIVSAGWVQSQAGATVTLSEDGIAIPSAGDDLIQTTVLYGDGSQPGYFTLRMKGNSDDHDVWGVGAMVQSAVLDLPVGKVPSAEFTFVTDSWQYRTASGDGLLNPANLALLPPIMGEHQGRFTLAGTSGGTAVTMQRAVGDLKMEISVEYERLDNHGGQQGVQCLIPGRRRCKISFFVPYTASDITGQASDWDTWLADGTAKSLMLQVGSTVGSFFSVLVPAGRVVAQPKMTASGRKIGWTIEMEPTEYTSDGASTGAGNSRFRIAFG